MTSHRILTWLLAAVVCLLAPAAAHAQSCTPPPANMIGWWALDETTGSSALDLTGFMGQPFNDGTTSQGPLGSADSPEAVTGLVGGGFRFDGIDDYVWIPHHASLDLGTGDFTLDMWIYPDGPTPNQMPLFSKIDGDTGFAFSLLQWSATEYRMQLQLGDGTSEFLYSTPFVVANQTWQHLAVVADRAAGVATFYLDGVVHGVDAIATTGSIDNSERAYIALHPAVTSVWFTGTIDEVELFDRALAATEVFAIFDAGSAGKCKPPQPNQCVQPPSDMLGWWPLDETSGSTAIDLTGHLSQPFNDGTTAQGPLGSADSPDAVAGMVDGAFRFESEYDYVEISHDASLNVGADDFSIDLWFYREDVHDMMPLFSKSSSGAGYGLGLQFAGGGNVFYRLDLSDGVTSDMILGPVHASPASTWIHLTVVVDRQNAEARFYVNGGLQASAPITITGSVDNTERAYIAFNPNFAGSWFTGAIDEVELFGRALSSSEIQELVAAGSHGKCKPTGTSTEQLPRSGSAHSLSVFPNPSAGALTLSFTMPAADDLTISIYDVMGRLVASPYSGSVTAGEQELELELDTLPAGIYVIRLSDPQATSFKVVSIVR